MDAPGKLFAGAKILLVEDDPVLREALAETITIAGHTYISAKNGKEALALLELHHPAVVLTDIRMDGMDGSQLLNELVLYGKQHCNIIILEGILNSTWYRKLFENILNEFNNQIFAYYFDIPFEETLNRHKQKPNANEFGEKEMRKWWNEEDLIGIIPEVHIHKELSLNEIVEMIYQDVIK